VACCSANCSVHFCRVAGGTRVTVKLSLSNLTLRDFQLKVQPGRGSSTPYINSPSCRVLTTHTDREVTCTQYNAGNNKQALFMQWWLTQNDKLDCGCNPWCYTPSYPYLDNAHQSYNFEGTSSQRGQECSLRPIYEAKLRGCVLHASGKVHPTHWARGTLSAVKVVNCVV
jgi:hypothetical protein